MTERQHHDGQTTRQRPAKRHRLAELTAFQRDVLWALSHDGPSKGLAVKGALEAYYDGPVNHSRVYTNLDDLVEDGYVEKGTRDQRTNEYRLTTEGRQALSRRRAWVSVGTRPPGE